MSQLFPCWNSVLRAKRSVCDLPKYKTGAKPLIKYHWLTQAFTKSPLAPATSSNRTSTHTTRKLRAAASVFFVDEKIVSPFQWRPLSIVIRQFGPQHPDPHRSAAPHDRNHHHRQASRCDHHHQVTSNSKLRFRYCCTQALIFFLCPVFTRVRSSIESEPALVLGPLRSLEEQRYEQQLHEIDMRRQERERRDGGARDDGPPVQEKADELTGPFHYDFSHWARSEPAREPRHRSSRSAGKAVFRHRWC